MVRYEDHGVALYELLTDGCYHLLARTHLEVHAYDWAVLAHDRKTLAGGRRTRSI
jgi:hypothetical protein